jgi:hypothetical protein
MPTESSTTTTPSGARRRTTRGLLALMVTLLALAELTATAGPATAAELTVTAGSGRISVSNDHFHPGERIQLTGTGLTTASGSGSGGQPVVAVKVNDNDEDFPDGWSAGGPDHVTDPVAGTGTDGSEGYVAFAVQPDGSFSGWIDIPGSQASWNTWLRFLGGSLTTQTGGVRLEPFSARANISIIPADRPLARVTSTNHYPGSQLTMELRNFQDSEGTPARHVRVTSPTTDAEIACVPTDEEGDGAVEVTLPTRLDGAQTLALAPVSACDGSDPTGPTATVSYTAAWAEVTSPAHPGRSLELRVRNFVRTTGGGQQVSLRVDGTSVAGCLSTDAAGSGTASLTLPRDLALGEHVLAVWAGDGCGAGAQAPTRSFSVPFDVTAAQPPVAAKKKAVVRKIAVTKKQIRLTLVPGTVAGKVTVSTQGKVKLAPAAKAKARKKVVLAKGKVAAGRSALTLRLTPKGRKAIAANRSVRAVVVMKAPGLRTSRKIVVLRRR